MWMKTEFTFLGKCDIICNIEAKGGLCMKENKNRSIMPGWNSPKYEPLDWEECLGAGCYPYALGLKVNQFFVVGDIIGKHCNNNVSDDYLIDVLKEEIEFILDCVVEEVETDIILEEGERLIYIQREEHTGYYHFLRQDDNGMWSHKYPNELPTNRDSAGVIIEDPDSMVEAPFYGWCLLIKEH